MKKIIYGCEARGDANEPYLSRWTILKTSFLKIYFHKFHRSDADDCHDHPWCFLSVILWRGYNDCVYDGGRDKNGKATYLRQRLYPGMIVFRKATHVHRVELIDNKPAYSLVFTGKYVRHWGFWIRGKFNLWTDYFFEKGC